MARLQDIVVEALLERGARVDAADMVSYCDALHGVCRVYGKLYVMHRMVE